MADVLLVPRRYRLPLVVSGRPAQRALGLTKDFVLALAAFGKSILEQRTPERASCGALSL